MIIELRGKRIFVRDDLYKFFTDRLFEFDEDDCKAFIRPMLTEGTLEAGMTNPNVEEFIDNNNEKEISKIMEKGLLCNKKVM